MKILVVDNDQMVRTVCSAMLQFLKHTTVTSESGAEAIDMLDAPDGCFDLLILDHSMPDMSGRETLAVLASRGLKIPVILCSGQPITLNGYCAVPGCDPVGMLIKPFSMQTLKSLLDSMWSDRPGN